MARPRPLPRPVPPEPADHASESAQITLVAKPRPGRSPRAGTPPAPDRVPWAAPRQGRSRSKPATRCRPPHQAAGTGIAVAAADGLDAAIRSDMQAGDRFRGGSEGGIAGGRVPAPASLDELDLVRVQAAHGSYGELTAWRAGRRSEEHTSELQSRPHLVCRLLL